MRVVVLLLALVGAAVAQDGGDVARQAEAHATRGEALANEGQPDEARAEYEEARALFLAAKDAVRAAGMLGKIGEVLVGRAAYEEALEVWRRYRDEQSAIHGGDHPDVAEGLNNVAYCLHALGRFGDALPFYEESLAMRRRLFEGDHPAVATALNNLASCLQALGRLREALPMYEESLAMCRSLFEGDRPAVARALNNVAASLKALGRPGDALPLFEESLAMCRRLFEGDHPHVALSLSNVADCLQELGRAREALPTYEESLAMCRRIFEGDHPAVAQALNNVAYCLEALGRSGDALPRFEESLAMRRRLFEGDHPDVARAMNNVAACLQALGRSREALPKHEESLAMRRRLFKGDHPAVAEGLNNVAACLEALGRPGVALPLFEESLAMCKRMYEGDHPDVATALNEVAVCLRSVGRAREALPRYEESLAMYRRLFEGDHPDVALALNNVAYCLGALGREGDALPLLEESLAMRRRLFESDHPDVAVALNNLAHGLNALGRSREALLRYEDSLAMYRRLFAGDHPDVARGLHNVAACLESLGQSGEALPLREEAVAMARRGGYVSGYMYATGLARVRLAGNEAAPAAQLLKEAIDQIEALRGAALGLTEADRAFYFGELKRAGSYALMIRVQRELGDDRAAFRYVERARARSLLDLLDRSRLDPLAEVTAQARERGDTEALAAIDEVSKSLDEAHAEVGRLTHEFAVLRSTAAEGRRAAIPKVGDDLAAARRAEQDALRRRAQLIGAQLRVATPSDAATLQRLAGRHGRVLVYSVSEAGTILFDVPPAGKALRAVDLAWPDGTKVTASSLAEKVEAHARWIGQGRGDARGVMVPESQSGPRDAGRALFRALVPVWEDLRTAKVVYIVGGGAIERLAFESLPVGDGYWIDEGPPIAYGPSGSVLLWSRERGDRQQARGHLEEAVALGDPVFARAGPPEKGVVVVGVTDAGQAKKVGIAPGDVIVAYDGKEIATAKALGATIREGSGEPTVALWRAGERREVTVAPGPLGVRISREAVADALRRLEDPGASAQRSGALSRYGELVPLPGTRREAEAIAKALGSPAPPPFKVTLLLGEDATAPNLRRAAPRARYLHIATHGLADETEFASYSSLALTLPRTPTAEDDGFLSLADVLAGWRGALTRCELVVLSACKTQRGYEQQDEGVFAMPLGFLYAGAPAVIGSLWRVDDASTADLFADFYARLAKGGSKLEAFTAARKALRKKYPEPYFWAPFVYIGDPR